MTTFKLLRLGAVSELTRDGSGVWLPEMFLPDQYDPL
jgi:hypothetical protein